MTRMLGTESQRERRPLPVGRSGTDADLGATKTQPTGAYLAQPVPTSAGLRSRQFIVLGLPGLDAVGFRGV